MRPAPPKKKKKTEADVDERKDKDLLKALKELEGKIQKEKAVLEKQFTPAQRRAGLTWALSTIADKEFKLTDEQVAHVAHITNFYKSATKLNKDGRPTRDWLYQN